MSRKNGQNSTTSKYLVLNDHGFSIKISLKDKMKHICDTVKEYVTEIKSHKALGIKIFSQKET